MLWGRLLPGRPSTPVERALHILCSSMSKSSPRVLVSSPLHSRGVHGEGESRVQFPRLPPEWEERFKPGQMYRNQASIPKLPVPPLQQTLQKYITSVEPLLSAEELEKTKAAVKEFGREGGAGEKLQQALLERAESHKNWLSEWWLHAAYLGYRLPVTVHSSPAIGYPRQPSGDEDTYARTAAAHLLAVVKWNQLLQTAAVPPDTYRGRPMCMSQYTMYSTCRIPGPGVDTQRMTPISDSRHVIVVRNGHFFKLDVLYETPEGVLAVAPSSHIVKELHRILRAAPDPAEHPVGILTSEHRETWYQARQRLIKDSLNQSTLDVIERAQFVMCLDRAHPSTSSLSPHSPFSDPHSTVIATRSLHGNGSDFNSGNRWFDSSVQIFVGEDGGCGSSLEHSAGDGPAAIATNIFCLDLLSRLKYDILGEPSSVDPSVLCPAEQLQWNISSESARDIETAKKNIDSLVRDVDLEVFAFSEFGKSFIKSVKMSPDGFIQIAIQLAYYKLYNHPAAMYESGATRWFKLGRTDTIRSCTNAALAFMKTMSDPNASVDAKATSIAHAVKAHVDYTNDAITGQAVDRHLLGLKILAAESEMETPDIFKDVAFSRSLHFCLSTSQVAVAHHKLFLCFGAVVEDGYGVCYNPMNKQILFSVSSFRHWRDTDSQLYGQKLMESMKEMHDVMAAARGLSSKL